MICIIIILKVYQRLRMMRVEKIKMSDTMFQLSILNRWRRKDSDAIFVILIFTERPM